MPQLAIALLGPLSVTRDGTSLGGFESDKVRALLALLAAEPGRPHRRAALADMLWPERAERAALLNLNQALANLRRVIGDREAAIPLLLSTRESIQLNPAADVAVDAATFQGLLAACATHAHRNPQSCQVCAGWRAEAVALARGPFLEGLAPRGCLAFEEWAVVTRERLHCQLLEALEALAAFHEQRDEVPAALAVAQRLAELDPWSEPAHRRVMRLLWREGRVSAALAQYERCRATLAAELGIEPEEETEALRRKILAGERGQEEDASQPSAPSSPPPAISLSSSPPPLLTPTTPFVGREEELALLADRLADPACRLITIVGLGGSGKTRLALQAAAAQVGAFADGIHVVPLAQVERPDELLPAIARALGLAPSGADDARAQLAGHLRERELLLVLDNLEQLRAATPELAGLLERAPRLTLLATSRERLGLRGEWTLALGGLTLPTGHSLEELERSGAAALFLDVARRARGYFLPDDSERRSIARICHTLAGHALAIELAASWSHVLSCAEIEGELARGAALLAGASQDLPERHRTIGAVLESTWALLTPAEQRALRALAVLPGNFQVETAEAVAGEGGPRLATLTTLAGLVNKGLLRREAGGYSTHAFVRQDALERLRAAGEERDAYGRLLAYVRGLVERAEAHLRSAEETAWLDRLEAEHGSIGAALEWALESGEAEGAAQLCAVLRWLWYIRGYIGEGRRWMEHAILLARGRVEPGLLARLLQGAGVLADEEGDYRAAAAHYAEGLAIYRSAGDRNGARIILNSLGALHNAQGRYAEARACFEESLQLSRELGQHFGAASALNNLGTLAQALGDLPAARAALAEALAIARTIGYATLTTTVLDNLGDTLLAEGDLPGALAAFGEALALQRDSGDVRGSALSLRGLGMAALTSGELERAEGLLFESLELAWRSPALRDLTAALDSMAALLVARGSHREAARLAGAAAACRERMDAALTAPERALSEQTAGAARAALGEAAFALAWAEGRALSVEQAVEELLSRRPATGH